MYSDGPLGASFVMLCFHRCFSAAFTYLYCTSIPYRYILPKYLCAIHREDTNIFMYLIFTSEDQNNLTQKDKEKHSSWNLNLYQLWVEQLKD